MLAARAKVSGFRQGLWSQEVGFAVGIMAASRDAGRDPKLTHESGVLEMSLVLLHCLPGFFTCSQLADPRH